MFCGDIKYGRKNLLRDRPPEDPGGQACIQFLSKAIFLPHGGENIAVVELLVTERGNSGGFHLRKIMGKSLLTVHFHQKRNSIDEHPHSVSLSNPAAVEDGGANIKLLRILLYPAHIGSQGGHKEDKNGTVMGFDVVGKLPGFLSIQQERLALGSERSALLFREIGHFLALLELL